MWCALQGALTVVPPWRDEGPNREGRRGTAETSMDEGEGHRMGEMPKDSRTVAGGTRKSTARERQTSVVAGGERPAGSDDAHGGGVAPRAPDSSRGS